MDDVAEHAGLDPNADPMLGISVRDEDTDALAILPLAILPFHSVTLRGLLMVKNNFCESVVQMFREDRTGAGHIKTKDLKQNIREISSPDLKMVRKIATLYSFDVYSLRIQLRALGLQVNDAKYLKISPSKQAELDRYVRPFTARLVNEIYGDDSNSSATTDVSQLFRDADPVKAREKLKTIAQRINVDLAQVPVFLEDYGDIYLSIAYYRDQLDLVNPTIDDFNAAMTMVLKDAQLSKNPDIKRAAEKMTTRVNKMRDVLRGRFRLFQESTDEMWADMNAEKFGDFKVMVEDNHAAIGGLLCKLNVKMVAWAEKFPSLHTTGPARFADFLMSDMRQGF